MAGTARPTSHRCAVEFLLIHYTRDGTPVLFVDPYNDYLSEGGKFWTMVEEVAKEVGLFDNLRSITVA